MLKSLGCNNLNKLILAHLIFPEQVRGNVDVLMVSETKIVDNFLIGNFLIHGFSPPYRLYHDSKGRGIMLCIREDIPSSLLATDKKPMDLC